ncbi:MAG: glycosyl hydrolase-related protein [Halanaerobiales bacterium]
MRLTLLKSPNYPDEIADYGLHEFTYSLYTHNGIYYESDLLKHADDLNKPLLTKEIETNNNSDNNNLSSSFAKIVKGNSRLEVIKKAEQSPNEIIMRFFEPYGGKDKVAVELAKEIRNVETVNLIENEVEGRIKYKKNTLNFEMDPFEIKTIKLELIDN